MKLFGTTIFINFEENSLFYGWNRVRTIEAIKENGRSELMGPVSPFNHQRGPTKIIIILTALLTLS